MRKVKGFVCEIAWDHELGEDNQGTTIYPSVETLKRHHAIWEECGIVEVEVTFVRVACKPREALP